MRRGHIIVRISTMAIKASFTRSAGLLSEFADDAGDKIFTSRDAAGNILVNGGAVNIDGGPASVATTSTIAVFGGAGNDTLALDESNGALPSAQLFGGGGNDLLVGGSAADQLFGGTGNDTLLGKGGNDLLFGGAGDDSLTGGSGDDQMFGGAGNDRMIWNPGDGTDLMEGGDGTDTAEVNGGNGAETFTVTAIGTRVRFDRLSPAPFSLDIGTTEELVVNANGGDDVITAGNGLAPLIHLTLDGGAGNDTITGGDGDDKLIGGSGNDLVNGGRGNDTALLGDGDDTFVWNPGDGSDVVDGGTGNDKLVFNGANIAEKINITANQGHVSFTRDVASISMDLTGIETVAFNALGGADNITVGDLTGTVAKLVAIDLGATGGASGDGAADNVTVNGTDGANQITVTGSGTSAAVLGLPAQVTIANAEAADLLTVNAGGGNDAINAAGLAAGVIGLAIDAGAGNDIVIGSQGDDKLSGGDGNDMVTGGRGNDTALLGNGDDSFVWNPGDGSDVVEGGAGTDTLVFNGANIAERMDIGANGQRVLMTRDVGSVVMDLNGVEHIQVNALGGADAITVGDLTGTGVTQVGVDLSAAAGSGLGDGAADAVTANGTAGGDRIALASTGSAIVVGGLAARLTVNGVEAIDQLTVNGGVGDDVIDASAVRAGQAALTLNGGSGNDSITGSGGNDTVFGGTGNDAAFLGNGDDSFVWNPGDGSDLVEGQGGNDTLQFNGANIAETMDISANGSRARMTRDVGNVVMDLNGVENINLQARGGTDTITVGDLTGTDVKNVNIDLSGDGTNPDGAVDTVTLNATEGNDVIQVVNDNGVVTVTGLGEKVTISHFDADDKIVINGLGGDDVIQATGLSGMQLVADGGLGDDVLIGSPGNDTLLGGAGDDILIGGGGQDVLDGGPGGNVILNAAVAGPAAQSAALLSQFAASSFVAAEGLHGETPIAPPPASQLPLLAQPHG
jgi:Ca2+-binding RTX toxin-like protein